MDNRRSDVPEHGYRVGIGRATARQNFIRDFGDECDHNLVAAVDGGILFAMTILSEHDLQKSIIAECDLRANQDPRWGLLMAIPNGQYRKGQRMEPGLRPGIPDLFLPVAREATKAHPAYHGMWMELKVGRNGLTGEQERWMRFLKEQGYYTCYIRDHASAAISLFEWYLEGEL